LAHDPEKWVPVSDEIMRETKNPPPVSRRAVALLLLAGLVLGLAQAALLPPFEGFDEHGHYSYIQQVAETGHWPRLDERMSKDVDDYLALAPGPDSIPRQWNHYDFFRAPAGVVAAARDAIQSPRPATRTWTPGRIENWQAQHPPLYYYVLAPVYLATKSLSLAGQLFALRAFSCLIAWIGLCITAVAALRGKIPERAAAPLMFAVAAWPLIFPMWFPEMARLGNDSLITVFAALTAVLAWRVTTTGGPRHYLLLGAVLGLALLTKATFLPVTAALGLTLGVWALLGPAGERRSRIIGVCATGVVALAVCAWWYLYKLTETGSLIGSSDVMRMHAAGGLIAGLMRNASLADFFVNMPSTFAVTFLWTGTWSFVVPPRTALLPLVALATAVGYGAWRSLRRRGVHPVDAFTLLTAALFLAALIYHSAVALSSASGTSPAWYLHSLAPILGLLVGYGICELRRLAWVRVPLALLLLYPLVFLPAVTLMNLLYFAGCARKLTGRMYFAPARAAECIADYSRMYDNLSVLTLPACGLALFVLGWIIAAVALALAVRSLAHDPEKRAAVFGQDHAQTKS
jgi:4-amino-4-deoxy-L-arabinose transferase-like glycosyltransferase